MHYQCSGSRYMSESIESRKCTKLTLNQLDYFYFCNLSFVRSVGLQLLWCLTHKQSVSAWNINIATAPVFGVCFVCLCWLFCFRQSLHICSDVRWQWPSLGLIVLCNPRDILLKLTFSIHQKHWILMAMGVMSENVTSHCWIFHWHEWAPFSFISGRKKANYNTVHWLIRIKHLSKCRQLATILLAYSSMWGLFAAELKKKWGKQKM